MEMKGYISIEDLKELLKAQRKLTHTAILVIGWNTFCFILVIMTAIAN